MPNKLQNENGGWIDVSVAIEAGMAHWPGNPPIEVERVQDMAHGDVATVSKLSLGVHTGTHMDAPLHFRADAPGIDRMPLAATLGRARVIAIRHPERVRVSELERHDIRRGERILLRTRNSTRVWKTKQFVEDFVHLETAAAEWIAARGVRTLGVDYLSVGGYLAGNGVAVHRALLDAGVWIIEGLDLSRVAPGAYELICLPLKLLDGDGAPARAILRPLSRPQPKAAANRDSRATRAPRAKTSKRQAPKPRQADSRKELRHGRREA